MKKILALMLSGVLLISSSICVLASESTTSSSNPPGPSGSWSAWADWYKTQWEETQKKLEDAKVEAAMASSAASAAEAAAAAANSAAAESKAQADAATTALSTATANLDAATAALSSATETINETTKKNEDLQKQVTNYAAIASQQSAKISELAKATGDYEKKLKAAAGNGGGQGGRGSSGGNASRNQQLANNNAVSYGGNIVAQGGHVEINGGKSNVTFIVGVPDGGTMNSANSLAASLKGSLINCVTVTSTVAFKNAKVNFYVTGVTANDNIAVYQVQNGKWVQLPTAEIRQDHVVVNMTRYGTIAFIRVPVLASVSY